MSFFIIDLFDKSRTQQKDLFLKEYLKDLALLAVRHAYTLGQVTLLVDGNVELCLLESGHVKGLQALAHKYHRATADSWKWQWGKMLASRDLTVDWSDENLPFLDVLMFLVGVLKFRRSQKQHPWKEKSLIFRARIINVLAKLLETVLLTAVITYMQQHDVYRADVPSRRLRPGLVSCFSSV